MQKVGLGMLKTKRMNPFEFFSGHSCKDSKGLQAALKKAREIEEAKTAKFQNV